MPLPNPRQRPIPHLRQQVLQAPAQYPGRGPTGYAVTPGLPARRQAVPCGACGDTSVSLHGTPSVHRYVPTHTYSYSIPSDCVCFNLKKIQVGMVKFHRKMALSAAEIRIQTVLLSCCSCHLEWRDCTAQCTCTISKVLMLPPLSDLSAPGTAMPTEACMA